jgi:hypothetical protein
MAANRTPRDLWRRSLDWLKETGWKTHAEDSAIADDIWRRWVTETDAECISTHHRDRQKLSDALESAFRPIRDERAADALIVLFLMLLEIRGRREGVLQRNRDN